MNFKKLEVTYYSAFRNVDDYENYLDALVLIDDLLCLYDVFPRCPGYFADGGIDQARRTGTLEMLSEPINLSISAITDAELNNNIEDNFERARQLYEIREVSSKEISEFLNGLAEQYLDVVHPAVAPD